MRAAAVPKGEEVLALVAVVAAAGQQRVGASARCADPARDDGILVEQWLELGDVAHGFRRSGTP